MRFNRILSLVQRLYQPEILSKADIDNPDQFLHQVPVIVQAWDSLAEKDRTGVVLADEVGLGKTFEALGITYFYLLHNLVESKRLPRVLIVLPSKLITKWEGELERFGKQLDAFESSLDLDEHSVSIKIKEGFQYAHQIRVRRGDNLLFTGENQRLLKNDGIFLITEDKFVKLMGERKGATNSACHKFWGFSWDVVIIDEAHGYARGSDGEGNQRSSAAKKYCKQVAEKGTKVVLCTATPFQLDTSELVALLGLIELNDSTRTKIARGIEKYNNAILSLQKLIEEKRSEADMHDLRLEANVAKEQLQSLLRPYIIRSLRPEREGLEKRRYCIHAVSPNGQFPWVYWQVKDWARELARSDQTNMRTFLPRTLQMTLSSPATLEQHLRKWKTKHPRKNGAAVAICKGILHELENLNHPKFESLRDLVLARIDQVSESLSRPVDQLTDSDRIADSKCVIFVNHPATIQSLIGRSGNILTAAQKLDNSIRSRTEDILGGMNIASQDLRLLLRREIRRSTQDLLEQRTFDWAGKIRIWETPYARQTEDSGNDYAHLRGVELGWRDDLSEVRAADTTPKLRSLGEEFTKYLSQRLAGSLNEYTLVCNLATKQPSNWQLELAKLVDESVKQKAGKALDDVHKWYFGHDNIADESRERLRLRLSRIAYAFKPQRVIEDLSGTVDFAKRQQVIDAFNHDLFPLILLCTSVAEEGIDLQKRCNTVIHYDLEWNPAKVEQREGRVDRLGRDPRKQVQVITYKLADTYDERIFTRCQNRKIWMELYLCKTWREEGDKTEEEHLDDLNAKRVGAVAPSWIKDFRLDLRPQVFEAK